MFRSLVVMLAIAGAAGCRPTGGPEGTPAPSGAALKPVRQGAGTLETLPWAQRLGLEQAMAASDPRHAPRLESGRPLLDAGGLVATFSATGARIRVGDHQVTLSAAGIGREGGGRRQLGAGAQPRIAGPEVRTERRRGVVEWWRSLPSGLEHGLTVAARPAGEGELLVEVQVEDGLAARPVSADAIALVSASGVRIATYAHLVVLDAVGARLPARMDVRAGRIVLAVDDAGSRYPLVVDPLLIGTQEAVLLPAPGPGNVHFGAAVALSADGGRALVGSWNPPFAGGDNAGSARVFVRAGASWSEEAALVPSGNATADSFGASVALSADGSRALVGVPYDDNTTLGAADSGSVRVFVRAANTWTEEATLWPQITAGAADDHFGFAVALSADGSRALVGAPDDDIPGAGNGGSVSIFVRTGSTWTQEANLQASGTGAGDRFGQAVALSMDASRVLASAPYGVGASGVSYAGNAHVFVRTGSAWIEEATLRGTGVAAFELFGYAVALSADGSRALVGAPEDSVWSQVDHAGSTRVFVRSGTTWTAEATLTVAGMVSPRLGMSVALSADGSRALIGATGDSTAAFGGGSARLFLRTGTSWVEDALLLAPDAGESDFLGNAVSLAADGSRALVGAYYDTTPAGMYAGSARVFTFGPADPNGTVCTNGWTCLSGFCVDGVCCNTACGGNTASDCRACSVAAGASSDGVCTAVSGRACDDQYSCTHADVCTAGVCAGTAITCTDDQCNTRACNGTASCTVTPRTGAACSDGNACTHGETCNGAGACAGGTTITCTSVPCITLACDGTAFCAVTLLTGTTCNDGDACTQTDTCQAGTCIGSNPVICGGADACHIAFCDPTTGACSNPNISDGTPCGTGCAATCQSGTCTAGGSVTCNPLDACHVAGVCNPATGMCTAPLAANGTACNDANACTRSDSCQAGVCAGTPVVCAASDACHLAGSCDPATGTCSNPPVANGTPCAGGVCRNGTCTPPDGGAGDGGPDAATGIGGMGGLGGGAGTGATAGRGGVGGAGGSAGGNAGRGGTSGATGAAGRGGSTGTGGTGGAGGATGTGGSTGTGGTGGAGGAAGTGGTGGAGGAAGTGGSTGTGGTGGAGGATGTGGAGGAGGATGTGGRDGGADARDAGHPDTINTNGAGDGCGCDMSSGAPSRAPLLLGVGLLLVARSRRRRTRSTDSLREAIR